MGTTRSWCRTFRIHEIHFAYPTHLRTRMRIQRRERKTEKESLSAEWTTYLARCEKRRGFCFLWGRLRCFLSLHFWSTGYLLGTYPGVELYVPWYYFDLTGRTSGHGVIGRVSLFDFTFDEHHGTVSFSFIGTGEQELEAVAPGSARCEWCGIYRDVDSRRDTTFIENR